jgi:hypothetical protein
VEEKTPIFRNRFTFILETEKRRPKKTRLSLQSKAFREKKLHEKLCSGAQKNGQFHRRHEGRIDTRERVFDNGERLAPTLAATPSRGWVSTPR